MRTYPEINVTPTILRALPLGLGQDFDDDPRENEVRK
jgi:hypothetical protein